MTLRLGDRAVVMVVAAVAASAGVHRLVADRLAEVPAVLRLVSDSGVGTHGADLSRLVELGAAAALAACWLWLLAGVMWVLVPVLVRGGGHVRRAAARGPGPRWVRALTLATLGLAVAQGPSVASQPRGEHPQASGLAGLPLPDRAVASRGSPVTVTVQPGDSLWSIAERLLPPSSPDALVDRAWRRIADTNSRALGPDVDLIFPGTTLRVPARDVLLGKELP